MNTPLTPEDLVNAFRVGDQTTPAAATLADGSYVLVWVSPGQDGSGAGIVGQHFSAQGERIGPEFIVNATAVDEQVQPAIAATADGGFVVTWASRNQDNPGDFDFGVVAQRFDPQAQPVGPEFVVNDTASRTQATPDVAGLPGGGFVITWFDDDANGSVTEDIRAQIFDAAGAEVGAEFTVNTTGAGTGTFEDQPAIAAIQPSGGTNGLAGGGFVVVWRDQQNSVDGSSWSILAQRYDPSGTALGPEFVVNTTTASTQEDPAVADLTGGRFVVVWTDANDGSSSGIRARVFEGDGTPLGPDFAVNVQTSSTQWQPAVIGTDDGGFVVAWSAFTSAGSGDGSDYGIVARKFDADGVALTGETVVNAKIAGRQENPVLAALANGAYVAAWQSDTNGTAGDGDGDAIAQRLVGDPVLFGAPPASPDVEAVSTQRTFDEAVVNAAPQRLDADSAAAVSDADSTDFAGGRLTLARLAQSVADDGFSAQDAEGQDAFGFDTSGAVAVTGTDVSVNGTIVGTIASDGTNGAPLVVDLTAGATPAAVEILVENLTYQNLSDDPRPNTALQLLLEDGSGGASAPVVIDVAITPEQDRDGFIRGETQVNTFEAGDQDSSAIATLADGGYVSVWVSRGQDGSGDGVYAQRYDAGGLPVGPEFRVNATTSFDQFEPAVAGLTDGGWVIVWRDDNGNGVRLNRYDATGALTETELQVETSTAGFQFQPDVAALSNGGYAVAWASTSGDGSSNGVYTQLFNAAGSPVGTETQVNQQTSGDQSFPRVAALENGRYMIVFNDRDPAGDGSQGAVKARLFDSSGVAEGAAFTVNTTTADDQFGGHAVQLAGGDVIVAWTSSGQDGSLGGVYYQRFTDQGVPVGGEVRVNASTAGDQQMQDIAALDTGGFVIAWVDTSTPAPGNGQDVFAQVFDADGTRIDGETLINSEVSNTQNEARLTALPDGNYVVQWSSRTSGTAGDGSGNGVFQQIVGDPAEIPESAAPDLAGAPTAVTLAENVANAGTPLFGLATQVVDPDSADFDGGRLAVSRLGADPDADDFAAPDDNSQDNVTVVAGGAVTLTNGGTRVQVGGVDVADIVSDGTGGADLVLDFLAGATPDRVETLVAAIEYRNASDDPVTSRTYAVTLLDGDGGVNDTRTLTVNVTPEPDLTGLERVGPETQVNSFTPGDQLDRDVAALADGGWVTVWRSDGQDGAQGGIYGQRYDADGNRVGTEFAVNTTSAGNQTAPVAAGLTGGGWVVAWEGNGAGDSNGVFLQRYDAAGQTVGGETLVNARGDFVAETEPAVAALAGDAFVLVYTVGSNVDGSSNGVFFQRFDGAGNPAGVETQANTTTTSVQDAADVAVLDDGRFVIVWESFGQDGSSEGVYARVFNPDGTESVAEFQVNTTTAGSQFDPAVAATDNGGFVVAYEDNGGADGSGNGILAQRFDAAANPLGPEFVVNDTRNSTQDQPDVIGLDNGRFVVTWTDRFNGLDGSGGGVFGQVYDTATGARIDGEFRINTSTDSTQRGAEGAALPGGAFVTAWRSAGTDDSDPSGNGVFQQVFGDPASFAPGAAPRIAGLSGQATLAEADVNAGFQRIEADKTVALADADSATFNGGSLRLSVDATFNNLGQFAAPDDATQDQLGLLAGDVGNGDVQFTGLGIGDTVSVDGTVIGTISGDGTDGQPFVIGFTAGATVEAVEALLGNLAYANISDAPAPDRRLKLDLTDDAGNAIPSQFIDLAVTPEADSTLVATDERRVNAHTDNGQAGGQIVELTGGGFVVVWRSTNQDNRGTDSQNGVFGQVYDAAGLPVGPEFLVNETVADIQQDRAIAATADGGFVVVYEARNQDNPGTFDFGVFAQRFNADGSRNGAEIQVNQAVPFSQFDPSVAAFEDGGFVVAFTSDTGDGSGQTIYQRVFDAAGVGAAEEIVNTANTQSNQTQPAVATLVDGTGNNAGHVVVFTALTSGGDGDGSSNGVFARIYDAAGSAIGPDFLVNTSTAGSQSDAEVAGLTGGGFVVVWTDDTSDGSSSGVFGQIYDNAGTAVGGEFRVNTDTGSSQSDPAVTAMADGGFVVSWSDSSGRDGSGWGVFGQRFDAAGARIDGQFQINQEFSSTQDRPDVSAFGTGLAAVWTSATSAGAGDGSGDGVFLRTFEAAPGPDTAPFFTDAARTVTLFADDVTAGAQILDDGFSIDDPDGSPLNGATLDIYYTTPNSADDQLSIAATGPVSVAGNQISHADAGGVVATIDATNDGANGAALTITYNASASPDIARDIGERVAFSSTDTASNVAGTDRGIGFYYTDGSGAQTDPDSVLVSIAAGSSSASGLAVSDWGLTENEQEQRVGPVSESALIAAPVVIDGVVDFDDFAGTSFAGGFVLLDESGGSDGRQQLSVADQGNGPRQIGFDGTTVSYEGTAIGTVNATENGVDGANLRIDLNAAATAEGIEALIEAFTYGLSGGTTDLNPDLRVSVGNQNGDTSAVQQLRLDIQRDAVAPATGADLQVNTFTFEDQQSPNIAALSDGTYVVTWTSEFQDNPASGNRGIFAQLYSAGGAQIGGEFQVNDVALGEQVEPQATGLPNGNFVVLWTDTNGRDGSGSGVFGQVFQNDGTPVGATFQVNEQTSSTQSLPDVVSLGGGRFMAVWTSFSSAPAGDGSGFGIFARTFDATGTAEGGEFQVNTTTTSSQTVPQAALLPDGDVMIVWEDQGGADGSSSGIFAQRVDGNGALVSFDGTTAGADEQLVNTTTTGAQDDPYIAALVPSAALPGGGFVVVWESADPSGDGIFGQIYDIGGNPVGGEFRVSQTENSNQRDPVVVGRDDGGFTVAWSDDSGIDGSGTGVVAQTFNADGTRDGSAFVVNTESSSTQDEPHLAELNDGTLVAAWRAFTSGSSGDGDRYGVFQKLFDQPAPAAGAMDPVLEGFDQVAAFDEAAVNAALQVLEADGLVSLTDMDSADFAGGAITVSRIAGSGQIFDTQLAPDLSDLGIVAGAGVTVSGADVLVDGTVIGTIDAARDGLSGATLEIALNAAATPEAVERVLARLGFADASDDPQTGRTLAVNVTDGDGGSTGNVAVSVSVAPAVDRTALPQGDEDQVNSFTAQDQFDAATAPVYDTAGAQIGYVTVWQSDDQDRPQDNGSGIFGQIFDLNGVGVGAEFRVTDHTEFNQSNPSVAGLTGGGFVVGWRDNSSAVPDGLANGETSPGVFGRVFDATGAPVTGDFLINDVTASTQREVELATGAAGGFHAVWTDDGGRDGSGSGVFLRDFDATGNATGAAVQVNEQTSSTQSGSTVVELAGGRIAAVWTSNSSGPAGDGSSNGVFARLFEPNGTPVGGEFQVNTFTAGNQDAARVAALQNGDFVVVWDSDNQDGSSTGIYQQRFDANGAPVGVETRVNEETSSTQSDPYVVALDTGGWVVAWADSSGRDGSGWGVFGQEFAADGSRVDGEFQINTEAASTQDQPRLVALPGGGFTASWSSFSSNASADGDRYGIFQQVFADPANVAASPDPVLTNIADQVADEAALNAGGVRIAPNGGFGDDMPADLSGAVLTVAAIENDIVQPQFAAPDNAAQDQFALAAVGGVSVSGTTVSVGGTPVGTIDSDGADGAPLIVTFTANADAAAVEAVLQAVTYANASDDPSAVRKIAVQIANGDGGAARQVFDLTITPETDGGVAVGGEAQTNSFITGSQSDSHVAALADGGYVIVWTSTNQDATGDNSNGVFGQRYDASGAPVGGEFQVNATTTSNQQDAQVVGLSTGGFAVAWEDFSGVTGDDSDQEIVVQVFDVNGAKVGGEVAVDSPNNDDPTNPALAAFGNGDFAVVYQARDTGNGFVQQVYGQRFDDQGGQVGAEFRIPVPPAGTPETPDVAVQSDGTFAVVFRDRNVDNPGDNDFGVFLQRYDATGGAVGGPVQVNTLERFSQFAPRIAATEDGGYVVVYESDIRDDFGASGGSPGIYAQRFDGAGNAVGAEFLVNEVVDGSQGAPDVAATAGGGFAVTYSDSNSTDGSGWGVFVQQYDAQGRRIDDPVQVNEQTSSTQDEAAIAALPGGNFVVSFTSVTSAGAGDGDSDGVFHRIIGDPADFASGGKPVLDGVNAQVTYAEDTLNGVPQLIDANGAAAVSDPDSADFDGGSILVSNVISSAPLIDQINPPDDLTQDQLGLRQTARITISGTTVSVDGTPVATIAQSGQNGAPFELALNASATAEIVELLVENLTYRNISDDPLPQRPVRVQITDGDGGASDPALVTINITPSPDAAVPVGGERQVNTTDTGSEDTPAVAHLPGTGGDFVVVFESFGTDGSREGIFGQRFDVNGNPVARDGTGLPSGATDEFPVNTTSTAQDQFDPAIAGFSDGSWVVVWSDDTIDGNSTGVAAQLFNADGTLNGTAFQVNSESSSVQDQPEVAVLDDDTFVVTWRALTSASSGDGSDYGIAARHFNADGTPVGGGTDFIVNTQISGRQEDPAITPLNDGGFLITWEDQNATDGSQTGIFAQRFDSSASAVGSEFQINTSTLGDQFAPAVTVLDDGNVVVAWTDDRADNSGNGVFAAIYAPDGTPVTEEFRVNDQRLFSQFEPAVAPLDTGGFVIAWSDNSAADGSGTGVFAQQYDGSGNRLDSQFQVNTTTAGTQDQPDVAGLPGGGFVVAYDGSVLIQVYGNQTPTVSPVSASGDEDTAIVLDEGIFDAGFTDPDGNSLQAIRIDTFPTDGSLTLSGVPVTAGQVIQRADLIAGNLVYTGNQDYNGPDSFLWTGSDGFGFAPASVAANITVNPVNDAPGLDAGPDTTLGEGTPLNRQLTLTDPDTDSRTFTVDFGDGSGPQTFTTASLTPVITNSFGSEGTFTVTVTVDDNSGAANAVETDTFDVTVINAPPNAVNDSVFVSEDGPAFAGDVRANDSDPGADATSVTAVNGQAADVGVQITLGSGALLTLNADGTFSYDPNGQFEALADFQTGNDSFTYTLSDGALTDTATVSVFVDGQNDAPDAVDDTDTVNATTSTTGDVLANDTDPDTANTLTVTELNGVAADVGVQVTLASGALLTLNADGTYSYDPNGAFATSGTDTFGYTVGDGRGGTDTATVTITVQSTNQPPAPVDDTATTDEATPITNGNVLANDSDPDLDPLTVTELNGVASDVGAQVTLASGALLTLNADGTFSYDPNGQFETLGAADAATDTVTYTVQDGQGGSATADLTVTITGLNDPPVAGNVAGAADEDGAAVPGDLLANTTDVDASDTLSVTEINGSSIAVGTPTALPSGAQITVQADGTFSYDPAAGFQALRAGQVASDLVGFTVSDGNGGTDTATLTMQVTGVNDAPDAVDDAFATPEDTALTTGNVLANDTDPDTADLPAVVAVEGQAGSVGSQVTLGSGALLTLNGAGGFVYDPNGQFDALQTGDSLTDTFTYTLADGSGVTDTATVTITVIGNSSDPVAGDDAATTDEDTATGIAVQANDSDGDGDPITVTRIAGQAAAAGVPVTLASGALATLNPDGTVTYDPNGQFESLASGTGATDTFTYTIDDGNGGTDTATVTVTIDGVNDAPVAQPDGRTTTESAPVAIDLLANNGSGVDSDVDAGTVLDVDRIAGQAVAVGASVTVASGAVVTRTAAGAVEYDPNGQFESLAAGESASDSFTYRINDGAGGTDTATVTVTIDGENDAPVAVDDPVAAAVGALLNGNVLADNGNGADSDPDASDVLAVNEVEGQAANVGTQITLGSGALLTLNADGTFAYDQNGIFAGLGAGQTGTDTFSYTISDGNGGTDTATVTVTVSGSNLPPVAIDDSYATQDGTVLTVDAASGLLANDSDPDAGDTLTVQSITGPSNGTINFATDGSFDYTPDAGFVGTETLTYTISDGAATDTATVVIDVQNAAPVASDDSYATQDGTVLSVDAASGLLANDSDPDAGDTLTVQSITGPSNGTINFATDGSFDYTPDAGFVGTETLTYTISDGAATDTATVVIDVTDVPNQPPVAVGDSVTGNEDAVLSGNVLTNDSDPDNDALTVTLLSDAGSGGLILNADGSFDYTPDPNFNGTDSFSYTLSDGRGGTDTATVSLTVTPVNDPPVAADDGGAAFTTDEDTAFTTGDVLANDADVDGDMLAVQSVDTTGTLGLVTDNGDGTFTYDPNGQFEALGAGDTATDSFTYTLSDGQGGTDTATVTVTIDGVDDATKTLVLGTPGADILPGTAGDDIIRPLGGFNDIVTGLTGADEFDFAALLTNGQRDFATVTDYEIGTDAVTGIAPGDIGNDLAFGGRLYLQLAGSDGDVIQFVGLSNTGELDFV